jgi:kynureninase
MTDFSWARSLFHLPEGVIYLDGNSLGPLPKAAPDRVARTLREEWGEQLIRAWNQSDWMAQPTLLGDRLGRLIGAAPGTVVLGDTLSVKVFQALATALPLAPGRKVILSDHGNFPSDLYMAQGLSGLLGDGLELKLVDPESVEDAIDDSVAVLMLSHVDYRTGRLHDMASLSAKARRAGVVTLWDLAHSAGAMPVDLAGCGVDFAVGCTYKFLNGGPGAPAFIYVAPHRVGEARPVLAGWLGHAAPFQFAERYRPAAGIERMRIGTPPVIALAGVEAALDIWDKVDIAELRVASLELGDLLIGGVEARCPELRLVTPREHGLRGSQVAFAHPEGYAVMQALIDRGMIGDFRAPDLIRFGITPLYVGESDIRGAISILAEILNNRHWDQPRFRRRARVT